MQTDPSRPRVLITGATGVLGRALLRRPAAGGYVVRGTGRGATGPGAEWTRANLASGEGVEASVEGVHTIIHAASNPRGDTESTDVRGTARLVEAARRAGVRHLVYVSIVGIDRVPLPYYRHKLAAEREVSSGRVPWTILRGTQFHDFVDSLLAGMMRYPIGLVPRDFRSQPVHVDDFADALWERVAAGPVHNAPEIAGPEVLTLGAMADAWKAARGIRKPILRLPVPGPLAAALRRGDSTSPSRAVGGVTWEQWLRAKYGSDRSA